MLTLCRRFGSAECRLVVRKYLPNDTASIERGAEVSSRDILGFLKCGLAIMMKTIAMAPGILAPASAALAWSETTLVPLIVATGYA